MTYSHLDFGQDFFSYEPDSYDVIVSNPPFSIKDAIIERLYRLGKPFAVLLPLPSLQGIKRYQYFKHGIQILCFDERIAFHRYSSMNTPIEGTPFASVYFCKGVLPTDLVIEHLEKFEKPLGR